MNDNIKKYSRRSFIGMAFTLSAGSFLPKTTVNPTYGLDFFSNLNDDLLKHELKISYSDFLDDIKNNNIKAIKAHDKKISITRDNGSKATVILLDNNHIERLINDRTINPNKIDVSFNIQSTLLQKHVYSGIKDDIAYKDLADTFINYWEIPTLTISGYFLNKEYIELKHNENNQDEIDDEELINIAYHEAGHAVSIYLIAKHKDLLSATVNPSESFKGAVFSFRKKTMVSKRDFHNDIFYLMSGRAAEEILGGKGHYSTGAGNDLEKSYEMATQIIEKGMCDDIGPIITPPSTLSQITNHIFPITNTIFPVQPKYSERMKVRIEKSRDKILCKTYDDAKKFIQENWPAVDAVAKGLLEHKELSADQIRELINEALNPHNPNVPTPSQ